MTPPLVLIDLDNTLVDREAGFAAWTCRFLSDFALSEALAVRFRALDEDGLRTRDDFARAVSAELEHAVPVESVLAHYARVYPECFCVSDATTEALRALREAGHALAIVTNGPPFQEAVIDHVGLRSLVDAVCVSAVVGLRKPDQRLFERAAKLAGAPLTPSSWMVGDSPSADIDGARLCGIRSIWIDRGRTWTDSRGRPTHSAPAFAEAAELILSMS